MPTRRALSAMLGAQEVVEWLGALFDNTTLRPPGFRYFVSLFFLRGVVCCQILRRRGRANHVPLPPEKKYILGTPR